MFSAIARIVPAFAIPITITGSSRLAPANPLTQAPHAQNSGVFE
jgi:hypothetical protein